MCVNYVTRSKCSETLLLETLESKITRETQKQDSSFKQKLSQFTGCVPTGRGAARQASSGAAHPSGQNYVSRDRRAPRHFCNNIKEARVFISSSVHPLDSSHFRQHLLLCALSVGSLRRTTLLLDPGLGTATKNNQMETYIVVLFDFVGGLKILDPDVPNKVTH